jgi:hypothetical protein
LILVLAAVRPAKAQTSYDFVPLAPCRIADTRNATGAFGGPLLTAGSTRSFAIPSSPCGIPSTAGAYSLNVTAVPSGPLGYISVWELPGWTREGQRGDRAGRDGWRGERVRLRRNQRDRGC